MRESAGLSRDELGRRAGVAGRSVEGIEQGRRVPGWDTVVALCQALGVSAVEFERSPGPAEKPKGGRPRKAAPAEEKPKPKRPRGRPKKDGDS
ncbi:MAG: helix-turn-helix transcriptional regulator [Gemmataceae bacterium]|nr:helix-turn-helix transcriptional regulator [Gemmataceae bacterium]